MIRRFFISLLALICLNSSGLAQDTNGCLSRAQLLRLQYAMAADVDNFLTNESWGFGGAQTNQTVDFFGYPLRYEMTRWDKNYFQNSETIYLYSISETNRIVSYQTNSTCYAEIRSGFSTSTPKIIVENNLHKTIIQKEGVTIEFRETTDRSYRNTYTILVYNTKTIDKAIEEVLEQQRLVAQMAADKQQRYLNTLAEADSLYKMSQFSLAKLNYERAQEMDPKIPLREEINLCITGIGQELNAAGDSFRAAQNYDLALAKYQEAVSYAAKYSFLKNQAEYARQKIMVIERIKTILAIRKQKVFQYVELNANEYTSFKQTLYQELGQQLATSPKGYLNFQYQISFDTLGNDNSSITSINSTIANFENRIKFVANGLKLKPSQLDEFYVASKDMITVNSNWDTYTSTYAYNTNGLRPIVAKNSETELVRTYLKSNSSGYGKYTISVLEKNVNETQYKDINITNYSTVGPEAALLSLLMPGMGTLSVTHGKKGWKRVRNFLLFSGVAIAAQRYSGAQYTKYQAATIQEDIDKYYTISNLSHKVSLATAGIAATIYVHDFFSVIRMGLSNKKKAYGIMNQLKRGGIPIQNQPVLWQ